MIPRSFSSRWPPPAAVPPPRRPPRASDTADGSPFGVFSFLSGVTATGGSITQGDDSSGTLTDGGTQDGTADTTADVTVTSSDIYVTKIDDDSEGDAADGFSLREALARGVAQTGADTIHFSSDVSSGTTITLTSAASSGSFTLGGDATLQVGSEDTLTVSAPIAGAFNLTKTGAGTLILSGNNTYSGGTNIDAGTLAVSGGTALSDGGAVTVASGASLAVSASETIGSLSSAGAVSLGSGATLTVTQNSDGPLSGGVSGTGALTKSGTAKLTLSGTNTYSGATSIESGELSVGGTGIGDNSAVTVEANGTLTLTGNETIGTLAGSGTLNLSTHTLTVTGTTLNAQRSTPVG